MSDDVTLSGEASPLPDAGAPARARTECASNETEETLSGDPSTVEEALPGPGDDVGFGPLGPSTECGSEEGAPLLSEAYRTRIAKCIASLGRTIREIQGMRSPSETMKSSFERAACIEAARQICMITEMEMENTKGEMQ